MDKATVREGKRLLGAWAKAKQACDAVPVHQGRKVGLDFDTATDERNLRRQVDDWLWKNAVALIEAAEQSK